MKSRQEDLTRRPRPSGAELYAIYERDEAAGFPPPQTEDLTPREVAFFTDADLVPLDDAEVRPGETATMERIVRELREGRRWVAHLIRRPAEGPLEFHLALPDDPCLDLVAGAGWVGD